MPGARAAVAKCRRRCRLGRLPGGVARRAPPEPAGPAARPAVDRFEEAGGLTAEEALGAWTVQPDPADRARRGGVHALQADDAAHWNLGVSEVAGAAAGAHQHACSEFPPYFRLHTFRFPCAAASSRTGRRIGATMARDGVADGAGPWRPAPAYPDRRGRGA